MPVSGLPSVLNDPTLGQRNSLTGLHGSTSKRFSHHHIDVEKLANSSSFINAANVVSGGGSVANAKLTKLIFGGILVLGAVIFLIVILVSSFHRVDEGHVGIYFRHGAQLPDTEIGLPGLRAFRPFVTTVVEAAVRPEAHFLPDLRCVTADGIVNVFHDVQVISAVAPNRISELVRRYGLKFKDIVVYNRIDEGIRHFCANNSLDEVYNTKFLEMNQYVKHHLLKKIQLLTASTLGGHRGFVSTFDNPLLLEKNSSAVFILNIFIPKPEIPPAIAKNYKEVKLEWARQKEALEARKTAVTQAETDTQNALIAAETERRVAAVNWALILQRTLEEANISEVQNRIITAQEKVKADASSYHAARKAESNQELLTESYMRLKVAEVLGNTSTSSKVIFGGSGGIADPTTGSLFHAALSVTGAGSRLRKKRSLEYTEHEMKGMEDVGTLKNYQDESKSHQPYFNKITVGNTNQGIHPQSHRVKNEPDNDGYNDPNLFGYQTAVDMGMDSDKEGFSNPMMAIKYDRQMELTQPEEDWRPDISLNF